MSIGILIVRQPYIGIKTVNTAGCTCKRCAR